MASTFTAKLIAMEFHSLHRLISNLIHLRIQLEMTHHSAFQSFLTELKDEGADDENQTFPNTTTLNSSAGNHGNGNNKSAGNLDNGNFVSNKPEVQMPRNLSVLYEDLEQEGDETAFPVHRHRVGIIGKFVSPFSTSLDLALTIT